MTVVRELNGVMAAVDANGGYVVTGGKFTREAREFAKGTKIELMDGDALEQLIGCVHSSVPSTGHGAIPELSKKRIDIRQAATRW